MVATHCVVHYITVYNRLYILFLQPTVTVKASVLNPAQYVLVAHYYQPYSSGLDVDVTVIVSGQDIEGAFWALPDIAIRMCAFNAWS